VIATLRVELMTFDLSSLLVSLVGSMLYVNALGPG
jgi:hypothetical protein